MTFYRNICKEAAVIMKLFHLQNFNAMKIEFESKRNASALCAKTCSTSTLTTLEKRPSLSC